jgi:hypothetical protein
VEIEIYVPAGKKIRFDKSITHKLNPSNFRVSRRYRHNRVVDIEFDNRHSFPYETNVDYVMQNDGTLKDESGDSINSNDYRYNAEADSINIQKQLDEEKRKREESERKIKELEQKQKEIKTSTGSIKIEKDEFDGAISRSPSLIFSHVRSYL